jgi:hypothetical protein
MKSACGICGRMEEDSLLIEQPYGWPAVCKECVAKLAPTLSPDTPIQASQDVEPSFQPDGVAGQMFRHRMVPPFTLVEAASSVAFWVKLFAFINILGGILLICGGCATIRDHAGGFAVGASGIVSIFFGIALLAATKWFMLFNMTLQDIGQRVRLNLSKEAKRQDGGATERQ